MMSLRGSLLALKPGFAHLIGREVARLFIYLTRWFAYVYSVNLPAAISNTHSNH